MADVHPEAEKVYNANAEALAAAVQTVPTPSPSTQQSGDAHISATVELSKADEDSYREYQSGITGEKRSCAFLLESGELVGLAGPDHESLLRLARQISNNKVYSESLSQEFVYDRLVDWIAARARASSEARPFIRFLEEARAKAVSAVEIWFPIPVITITRPFQIGKTWFRRVTKPMVDELLARLQPDEQGRGTRGLRFVESRIQGATAACVAVVEDWGQSFGMGLLKES